MTCFAIYKITSRDDFFIEYITCGSIPFFTLVLFLDEIFIYIYLDGVASFVHHILYKSCQR